MESSMEPEKGQTATKVERGYDEIKTEWDLSEEDTDNHLARGSLKEKEALWESGHCLSVLGKTQNGFWTHRTL
jgi:hypothetical protein